MKTLINIRNHAILFAFCWIAIHFFYFVKYSSYEGYEIKEFIVYGFKEYIGHYTVSLFAIITFIILILLYQYSKTIILNARKQAFDILEKADIEINKIKRDLNRQEEKLESEKIRLESNYKRKNMEKSFELEAIRRKLGRLKKNQYDPRKQRKIKQSK
jgi:uncharacterized membrane protein YhiD involved in acid resistance